METLEYLKADLVKWAKKPYDEDADLFQWFLTIGALTCAAFLWTLVIRRIVD